MSDGLLLKIKMSDLPWYIKYIEFLAWETRGGKCPTDWICEQKLLWNSKDVSEKINVLSMLEYWDWGTKTATSWWNNYLTYSKNSKATVSAIFWADIQKQTRERGLLIDSKIKLLDAIPGWTWEREINEDQIEKKDPLEIIKEKDQEWYEKYMDFVNWSKENEGKVIQKSNKIIYNWISYQKTIFRGNISSYLKEEKGKVLSEWYEWDWGTGVPSLWTHMYKEYVIHEGGLSPRLVRWANSQKLFMSYLPKEKIELLESLSKWEWEDVGEHKIIREKDKAEEEPPKKKIKLPECSKCHKCPLSKSGVPKLITLADMKE